MTMGRFITRVESPQVAPCLCEVKFVNVFVKKVSRVGQSPAPAYNPIRRVEVC